ncbi:MAG: ribose-phosphate pyrophosphokinae, partial [Solirubrobacteraceae bacterium]|nr:ribose-phosphate pyrophosphokinae [Solirubrobacteraceae bacterium]
LSRLLSRSRISPHVSGRSLEELVLAAEDLRHGVVGEDPADRVGQQVAEIGYVIGDVKGKTAVIVDDIIDTASTLKVASQTVLDAGARAVYAAATHPVLSGNAFENLDAAGFEQIVVTDTIPLRAGAPDNIKVLSCAELLTDSIRSIFADRSVSDVFGGENQLF